MPVRNGEYQNLYTPLSQNMTDFSDDNSSEEELHSATIVTRKPPAAPTVSGTGRQPPAVSIASNTVLAANGRTTTSSTNGDGRRRMSSLLSTTGTGAQPTASSSAAAVAQHRQMLESLHRGHSDGSDLSSTHFVQPNRTGHSRPQQSPPSHHQSHLAGDGMADNVAILGRTSRSGSNAGRRLHEQFAVSGARPPMSARRRCLFVASIALCVLTVVVFVWVVPCSDGSGGGTCPARAERPRTQNWMRHYEGLELKGAINVVRGVRGRSNNLVFMYRGERLLGSGGGPKRNGIIALVGSTGAVSWYDEIVNEPSVIDCSLIDADCNGVRDCLVLDEYGELGCIDPVSGTWLWHIAARTVSSAGLLSFPLVLPDMNADGVEELLLVTTTTTTTTATKAPTTTATTTSAAGAANATTGAGSGKANSTYSTLRIVSGATGRAIGAQYVVRDCSYVHKFQLDAALRLTYNCIKTNGTEFQIAQALDDLQRLLTNRTTTAAASAASPGPDQHQHKPFAPPLPPPPAQHKFYGQRRDTLTQRNIYAIAGRRLIVENAGRCPEACNVTVQLVEQRAGKEHVLQNFSGSRMYGMVPALLSFNASAGGGRRPAAQPVHGFVIKFWQWTDNETDVPMPFGSGDSDGGVRARRTRRDAGDAADAEQEFNRFEHVLPDERPLWRYPEVWDAVPLRLRRSTRATMNGSRTAESATRPTLTTVASAFVGSRMRVIRERVVLIVFNSTDTRIENTSQSNIVQFCRHDDAVIGAAAAADDDATTPSQRPAVQCQPDLNYQENSVLIADLDGDGSQELVTYYTTYVSGAGGGGGGGVGGAEAEWRLVNYVQLLRLEAELPKLYVVEDGGRV